MERPILFSGPMVQEILELRKTMTRRVINKLKGYPGITEFGQSDTKGYDWHFRDKQQRWHDIRHDRLLELCPYGQVGDRLWVREKLILWPSHAEYAADGHIVIAEQAAEFCGPDGYRNASVPAIHMPKWACRILLEITNVRIERLQDISEADAKAEGLKFSKLFGEWGGVVPHSTVPDHFRWFNSPISALKDLWQFINGADSWAANPWVWVVSFRVVQGGDL